MSNKELPSKCPECGYEGDKIYFGTYTWEQIEPETNTRDATCIKCKTTFFEIYKCVGWEKL